MALNSTQEILMGFFKQLFWLKPEPVDILPSWVPPEPMPPAEAPPEKPRTPFVIKDRRRMLKIKLKSLMEEAKIIRCEERKSPFELRNELRNHRVLDVRSEARHTHLAYGFIRGMPLERIEQPSSHVKPDWKRVITMMKKYGPKPLVFPLGLPDEFDMALSEMEKKK